MLTQATTKVELKSIRAEADAFWDWRGSRGGGGGGQARREGTYKIILACRLLHAHTLPHIHAYTHGGTQSRITHMRAKMLSHAHAHAHTHEHAHTVMHTSLLIRALNTFQTLFVCLQQRVTSCYVHIPTHTYIHTYTYAYIFM